MRPEARRLLVSFTLADEKKPYIKMVEKFSSQVIYPTNVVYESGKLHIRVQQAGESVDEF